MELVEDSGMTGGMRAKEKVLTVSTPSCFGSRRRLVRLAWIPYVFGSSQRLQGREYSSSPISGTTFSLVRGEFALTCVQSLWSRRSDGWLAVSGLAAAMACSGVWGGGFKSLAGEPSACREWVLADPRSGYVG